MANSPRAAGRRWSESHLARSVPEGGSRDTASRGSDHQQAASRPTSPVNCKLPKPCNVIRIMSAFMRVDLAWRDDDGGEWVPDATREAMRRASEHAAKVRQTNTDEFTFRAFFMTATHDMADRKVTA